MGTCLRQDGSYGGSREDCIGKRIHGNKYKLPHPKKCLDLSGNEKKFIGTKEDWTKEDCEGVSEKKVYSAPVHSVCRNSDGAVIASGMNMTKSSCEGHPTGH